MALPVPALDDRTFQDIVNEARRKIPLYCPEWTDHNLSDPGITLIELFSWMTEMTLYRLNQVPDKNYVKFLELIGVELAPAAPASTEITLRLSGAQLNDVNIPSGTEIATVRTETDEAIVFSTVEDTTISPASLSHFLVSEDSENFTDRLTLLANWQAMIGTPGEEGRVTNLFADVPAPGNAFYMGIESDIRRTVLNLNLRCAERAAPGVVPTNPPIRWEYWDAEQQDWTAFERNQESEAWIEQDGTRGLNTLGEVILHVPRTAGETTVGLRDAYWIRCVVIPGTDQTGEYTASPQISWLAAAAIGGVALAHNVTAVDHEVVGTSDGHSGQTLQVGVLPALPLLEGETVEVELEDESGWELWEPVVDFSNSRREDKHFIFDPVAGEVRFGPVIRSPQGEEVQYGAIPPAGMQIGLTSYRYGGGPEGNVGQNTITELQSSIPYVDTVTNRRVASGGVDPEGIENAKMRGPQTLRTRNRAITAEDFEHLAREASPSVMRARCIQPTEVGVEGDPLPGVVRVLLVPTLPATSSKSVTPDDLRIPRDLLDHVREYLDERRLLTTMLIVSEPEYHWASVEAQIKVSPNADPEQVKEAVEKKLFNFIHPINGGTDGNGWTFGRSLFASELYSQIQPVQGVEYVEGIKVFPVDPNTGELGEETDTLLVPRAGLLCSYEHNAICSL